MFPLLTPRMSQQAVTSLFSSHTLSLSFCEGLAVLVEIEYNEISNTEASVQLCLKDYFTSEFKFPDNLLSLCHPRCLCLSFFSLKEIKVFEENIPGFFSI